MTLVHFPSNASTPRAVRGLANNDKTAEVFSRYVEEADRLYEKEGSLLKRCASLRNRVEALAFSWNHLVPSEGAHELDQIEREWEGLPAPATHRVQQVASAIAAGISELRFRRAFPIVAELDADSLIPTAADKLPDATVQRMEKTAALAKSLFERGDPRALELMKALETAILHPH